MSPTITQKLWTGGLLESHNGDSLFIQWLILLGCGVDNTHSYYGCLDSHGKDSSSPQSICDGLLPNYIPKK